MWETVVARRDARFVFAVTSTGIYCRPTCPARRPRRDRVRFHATAAEAEAAGFRACRRCRPKAPTAPVDLLVKRARAVLDGARRRVTLAELAEAVGVSPFHLQRTFKRVVGVSPAEYARRER